MAHRGEETDRKARPTKSPGLAASRGVAKRGVQVAAPALVARYHVALSPRGRLEVSSTPRTTLRQHLAYHCLGLVVHAA